MIEKKSILVFPCKRAHVSESEKPTFLSPHVACMKTNMKRRRKKKKHSIWSLVSAALWSLQTFSNANTAEKQQSVKLSLFPPSHYLICHCGCAINFSICPPGAASFTSFFCSTQHWKKKRKRLQPCKCRRIDSGVGDSKGHMWHLLLLPAIPTALRLTKSQYYCTDCSTSSIWASSLVQ